MQLAEKGHRKAKLLFAAAALAAMCIGANARDDRLPAKFVGDWCLAEHTADHLAFYRRGRCSMTGSTCRPTKSRDHVDR